MIAQGIAKLLQEKLDDLESWCKQVDLRIKEMRVPSLTWVCGRRAGSFGSGPYPWIVNLGNTCWMSVVIRCAIHCPAIRDYIVSSAAVLPESGGSIIAELRQLTTECTG